MRKNINSPRLIYDNDYYTLLGIFQTSKYELAENSVRKKLSNLGLSIPKDGFPSAKEYNVWLKKAEGMGVDYKYFLREMASAFNLDIEDSIYRISLWRKLFFNNNSPQTKPLIRFKEDSGGLWLRINPWTKKEDIVNFWDKEIKPILETLLEYRGKEKPWVTFDRDFKLYLLYLRACRDIKAGIKINKTEKSKSPYFNMPNYPEFELLTKGLKDPEDQIRSIIPRCQKVFKDIQLI